MKERFMTLLTALAALALVIFLFSPPRSQQKPVSLPTSEDRGPDGLKGLYSWLGREGLAVVSFRKRFTDLRTERGLPEQGNVLIVSMPAPTEIRGAEWSALSSWLDQGNTLIVLGAVYQHPAWVAAGDCFCGIQEFLSWYDWTLEAESGKSQAAAADVEAGKTLRGTIEALQAGVKEAVPQPNQLLAQSGHPLLQGVRTLDTQTRADLLKQPWTLSAGGKHSLALRLLGLAEGNLASAWQLNAGSGRIVLLLTPDLFSNSRLGRADNARFIGNLLDQSLAPDGRLLFDDYHFGLSELYDPEHFFKDERLHNTLACLGIFWLLYLIGYTTRLAPVRPPIIQLSSRDFIQVTAEFFARRLTKAVLAEALVKHLLADIHHRRRLRDEAEVWHWLAQHGRVTGEQLRLLKKALNGQRISLFRLSNTITYIRTVTL